MRSGKLKMPAAGRAVAGAVLLAGLAGNVVAADAWPSRPIQIVVPFPAGGGVDIVARTVGGRLAQLLGRPVVVDNRPGAGATLGAEYVARSAPDGHTVLLAGTSALSIAPLMYPKLSYVPLRDLVAVVNLVTLPQILVVHPSLPVRSASDLIALARRNPDRLNMASGGQGTGQHLAGALFTQMAGIRMTHVPYKGTTPAINDLMGGHVDLLFADPSVVPTVRGGRLRALGVSLAGRYHALPEVPPIGGSGLPGYEAVSYYALTAPAGTPPDLVTRLNEAFNRTLADAATRDSLQASGLIVDGGTPEQLADRVRRTADKWARVIKAAGIRPE